MAAILLQVAVSAALSYVARLLAPAQEGPRLQDLKLHGSSYGGMNPLLWGTMRLPGNVIDETDLEEHKHTSGGKGGGPKINEYSYTVSVAIRLCDVELAGVTKIWANGELIYGGDVDGSNVPVTFYLGTEDQLPDPTFEAVHGVGNVPAYRGTAYAVFTDWDLTHWANTLPSLNFECTTKVGEIPVRVSTFDPSADSYADLVTGSFDGTTITVWSYHYDTKTYDRRQFLLDGTPTGLDVDSALDTYDVQATVQNADIAAAQTFDADPKPVCWIINGVTVHIPIEGETPYGNNNVVLGNYLYCVTNRGATSGILRFPMVSDAPGFFSTADVAISANPGDLSIGYSTNGKVYVFDGNAKWLYEFDEDLVLQHTWTDTDWPGTGTAAKLRGGGLIRYGNIFAMSYATGLSTNRLELFAIAGDNTLTLYDQPRTGEVPDFGWDGQIVSLGGGYILGHDGVALLKAPNGQVLLSDIVTDISVRAGLEESQIDVTDLTDLVDGYLVSQQGSARAMLQPLRDTYFFDAVESDDKVKFVKRGKAPVFTIPDDDLAAHVDSESLPPLMLTTRTQEVDLPATVNVDYVNPAADYQTGTQVARRLVTDSQSEMKITLPVSLSDAHAKAVADVHLFEPWQERQRHSIQTSRKYAKYEPTDVGVARGQTIVIRQKQEVRAGVIKFDGVATLGAIYTAGGGAVATKGFVTTSTSAAASTTALLMDLPLLNDSDDQNGFYAAMSGDVPWTGAALMKSSDGTTYSSITSTSVPAVKGVSSDVLDGYLGGNTFDEGNTVTVVLTSGDLSSATEDEVLNGANEAVLGDEIIQFKTATLTDTNTYELSGLLRGRHGTEWAMNGHAVGERFVLLPVVRAPLPFAELNLGRTYKPVTFGTTLASTVAQGFTNTGVSVKPLSPVLLGGGTDASGNVTLNWTRRTRIGGGWVGGTDVPLSEASEQYVVQIWNSDYTSCARILTTVTSPTATYTSAQQVTDFGSQQQTIYFTVGQIGAAGIGFQARGTAVGAGGSNTSIIAPVSPYSSPTSGSPTPPPTPGALNLSLTWANPGNQRTYSNLAGAFDCSHTVIVSFTTPSGTSANVGRIFAGEWVSGTGPIMRTCCLSTVAGDFSGTVLGANSRIVSTSPTVQFTVGANTRSFPTPALSPSTTYYFNIKNDNGFGACTCFTGDCDMFIELQKPTGL